MGRGTLDADVKREGELDWSVFERGTAAHWAAVRREKGVAGVFEVASALNAHVRALRPDWPTEAERKRDHDHHLALIAILDRVPRRDR
jgi:hypothetical protein